MLLSDFDFDIPKRLIAEHPLENRDASRLLVMQGASLRQEVFASVADFLNSGDVLVLNNTKVIKSRIILDGIEIFFHRQVSDNLWRVFTKPARKVSEGQVFEMGGYRFVVKQKLEMGEALVEFEGDIFSFFDKFGKVPLPLYIKRESELSDERNYQTVFAKHNGSVAAPTAGLHFTRQLLERIESKGIKICYVTLHVGAGTFLPVKTEDIDSHKMHTENYSISAEAADTINKARSEKRRIIAVGTTALRALESAAIMGELKEVSSSTNLFVRPGFKFSMVDMLITNFHLPKSTLLMLVSAFGGYENVKAAYEFAVNNNFRFYSYGDANLIYRYDSI